MNVQINKKVFHQVEPNTFLANDTRNDAYIIIFASRFSQIVILYASTISFHLIPIMHRSLSLPKYEYVILNRLWLVVNIYHYKVNKNITYLYNNISTFYICGGGGYL